MVPLTRPSSRALKVESDLTPTSTASHVLVLPFSLPLRYPIDSPDRGEAITPSNSTKLHRQWVASQQISLPGATRIFHRRITIAPSLLQTGHKWLTLRLHHFLVQGAARSIVGFRFVRRREADLRDLVLDVLS
jgi:hypothetical protein